MIQRNMLATAMLMLNIASVGENSADLCSTEFRDTKVWKKNQISLVFVLKKPKTKRQVSLWYNKTKWSETGNQYLS